MKTSDFQALFHNKFIYAGFTMPFYKKMLNKKLTLKDLESVDEHFYKSTEFIMENDIGLFYFHGQLLCKFIVDGMELELYFVADYELLGEVKTHELKEGGTDIMVTEENKEEYLKWVWITGLGDLMVNLTARVRELAFIDETFIG